MALIKCEECGKQVSDKASACPNCGCPIEKKIKCEECGTLLSPKDEVCPSCGCPIENDIVPTKTDIIGWHKIWLIVCIIFCFLICSLNVFNILHIASYSITFGGIAISVMGVLSFLLGVSYISLLKTPTKYNFYILMLINLIILIYNIFMISNGLGISLLYIACVFANSITTFLCLNKQLDDKKYQIKDNTLSIIIALVGIILILIMSIMSKSSYVDNNNNNNNDTNDFNNTIDFEKIVDSSPWTCDYYKYCIVASDGSYLKFDTKPNDNEYSDDASTAYFIEDVNERLGFSSSLYAKMESSRGIDGKQTEENDKVKVTWSYVSSKGLEVIYELK